MDICLRIFFFVYVYLERRISINRSDPFHGEPLFIRLYPAGLSFANETKAEHIFMPSCAVAIGKW